METPGADAGHYRREAIGAFAHDLRTPLTALRMAIDIGRQAGGGDTVALDEQLAGMVDDALAEIEQLTDALQEASRLDRGKASLTRGHANLADVLAAADALAGGALVSGGPAPDTSGSWDADRLARAVAGVATAVARLAGTGAASLTVRAQSPLELDIRAGDGGGRGEPFAAEAGFRYFHARQVLEAMGATVVDARGPGFAFVRITLPK